MLKLVYNQQHKWIVTATGIFWTKVLCKDNSTSSNQILSLQYQLYTKSIRLEIPATKRWTAMLTGNRKSIKLSIDF